QTLPVDPHKPGKQKMPTEISWKSYLGVFKYSRRALQLVWATDRGLAIGLALGSLIAGTLPSAVAVVGKHLLNAILFAAQTRTAGARNTALEWLGTELALVIGLAVINRLLGMMRSLLRQQLGQKINVEILEKALTLELRQFEDSELYDSLTRARREASSRPLSLVSQTFELGQSIITLITLGALLAGFSPIALGVLIAAAIPPFVAELKFSGDAFRLSRWRTPETREQLYVETVLAREDHAKEVKLFGLGPRFLDRYKAIFHKLYAGDRQITIRRAIWAVILGAIGTLAFYGMYLWIAIATIDNSLSAGEFIMYAGVFKAAQSAMASALGDIGGMYEDNLYLSNLYEFLDTPTLAPGGTATSGPRPGDGVRFEGVSFTYPGVREPALSGIDLHIPPGSKLAIVGENGSGKTTLIKLLTRLYEPSEGRITLDGRDLREWSPAALHRRIGVIFQDFVRYQLKVGENIGAGDDRAYEDRDRWADAAERGLARPVIEALPERYDTQLGKWFRNGRELSLGQWQKVALARSFMRRDADVLVLDEPTASMDAEAEVKIFERFRELTDDKIAIVISHRFSTVRMADQIIVLDRGTVIERGSHDELVREGGRYATLFNLQAQGYR
ncbi:MAG TPA: ABC transporter ATP-binding protein, partial [Kofleriaceae bacterium]|nr:ABC transporter ATP-binding protein [Kofleriaceae bacterium]